MVSFTNDRYLRRDVVMRLLYEKMEPDLVFLDLVTPVREDNAAFMYRYDNTGKSSDTKKEKPSKYMQSAALPEIDRSRKVSMSELTAAKGFAMRIPRDVIRNQVTGANEIMEDVDYAGFWMSEYINTTIATTMTTGATTPTWTPHDVWSSDASTPVEDLRLLKYSMRREGYPFRLTDTYVNIDNFKELEGYLTSIDVNATKQQMIFGEPSGGDNIRIPVAGLTVHGVDSGITEGYILGLDRNNPAAEYHYYNDPQFAQQSVSYQTVVDNQTVNKTVNNIGIHFNQFVEDDTHDTVLQFWVENKVVVTKPYGLLYDNGI